LYNNKFIKANHDVNKGGFIITITEMCFKNNLGAALDLSLYHNKKIRDDELLFSESAGRFILETESKNYQKILKIAEKFNVEAKKIGVLTNLPEIRITGLKDNNILIDLKKLKEKYDSTIPNLMDV